MVESTKELVRTNAMMIEALYYFNPFLSVICAVKLH